MKEGTVFLVDDDAAVRDGLAQLLQGDRLLVRAFASAEEFLAAANPAEPGCIVLDVRLPGASGPELQKRLAERGGHWPIIFLTGYGDVPTTVTALKAGAVDFLEKPAPAGALLERVHAALDLDAMRREAEATRDEARARMEQLTPREQEVMVLVAAGTSNKEIARQLRISHRTVETHRARVMRKMGAGSLLELVRIAESSRPRR